MLKRGLLRLATALALCVTLPVVAAWPAQAQLSDVVKTGDITALNGTITLLPQGRKSVGVVLTGTWTATVIVEGSIDGGTTWEQLDLYDPSARARAASTAATGTFLVLDTGGFGTIRAKASAYTSGTVSVVLRGTDAAPIVSAADVLNATPGSSAFGVVVRPLTATGSSAEQVQGTAASGSAAVGNPVQVGGIQTSGTMQTLKVGPDGYLWANLGASSSVIGGVTGSGTFTVGGVAADGAAVSGNPVRVAGKDSAGNTQDLVTGLDGSLYVALQASSSVIGAVTQSGGPWTVIGNATGSVGSGNVLMAGLRDTAGNAMPLKGSAAGDLFVTLQASSSTIGNVGLNAGTNYIGKVRKTDGMNDVGTFVDADSGGGTEYREGVVLRKSASGGSVELGTATDPVRTDPTGTTTQPVSGTVTANAGTGTFTIAGTVTQGASTSLPWPVVPTNNSGVAQVTANGVKVDGSGVTQPVSGTVTANAGTGTFTVGGAAADGAAVSGNPVRVAAKDASGNTQDIASGPDGSLYVALQASSSVIGGVTQSGGPWTVIGTSTGSVGSANGLLITGRDTAGNAQPAKVDTTGAFQVDIESTPTAASSIQVQGAGADGSTAVGNPLQVGGKDSAGNTQTLASGLDGSLYVVLQASSSVIGAVTQSAGPWTVIGNSTGSVGTANGLLVTGRDSAGAAQPLRMATDGTLRIDPSGTTTQPVSGTVTSNQGGAPWTQRIQDGAGATLATVTGANALKVDGSAVTQPVSGTVTANAGTGNFSVVPTATGSVGTANVMLAGARNTAGASDYLSLTANGLKVDNSAVTQPVSGTVTANAGTGTFTTGGAAADGAAVSGNPTRVAGKDSAGNTQDLVTGLDGSLYVVLQASSSAIGKLAANSGVDIGDVDVTSIVMPTGASAAQVQGTAADGAAAAQNPVQVAGKDGSGNAQAILTDTGGAVQVDVESGTITANAGTGTFTTGGAAADGAAVSGNPTRVAGKDASGNTQDLVTGLDGSLYVTLQASSSVVGAVTQSGTWTVTANAGTGTFTTGGAAADGAAVSGNPTRIAGKDGSGNTQDVLTDTGGAVQVDIESIAAGDTNIGNVDIVSLPALSTGPVASNPRTDVGTSVATQLIVASTPCKKVTLVFDDGAATNGASGVMWVGGSSVAANNGIPMRAGQSLTLEVGNANTVWLFCTTASQKVSWVAEN